MLLTRSVATILKCLHHQRTCIRYLFKHAIMCLCTYLFILCEKVALIDFLCFENVDAFEKSPVQINVKGRNRTLNDSLWQF